MREAMTRINITLRRRLPRTKTCPHCNAHIEFFEFRERRYEYGRADLNGDTEGTDDSEFDDEFAREYTCPECEGDINPDSIPLDPEEPEIQAQVQSAPSIEDEPINVVDPTGAFNAQIHRNTTRGLATIPLVKCTHCEKSTEMAQTDRVISCAHCGEEITNPHWTGGQRPNRPHHD